MHRKRGFITLTHKFHLNKWRQLICTILLTLSFGLSKTLGQNSPVLQQSKKTKQDTELSFSQRDELLQGGGLWDKIDLTQQKQVEFKKDVLISEKTIEISMSKKTRSPISHSSKVSDQASERLVVSPNKKKILLIRSQTGQTELWIMKVDGTWKKKITKLREDEGAMSIVWSPDGELIAFVSYNLMGHSPMTTTHVWVVQCDGRDLRKVTLPKPNDRFSTYEPEWKTNEILIFKAITLDDPSKQRYMYNYRTGEIIIQ